MSNEMPQWLMEMSHQMREQPNRITAHPFWQVRCKRYLPCPTGYNEHHREVCGEDGVIYRENLDDISILHDYLIECHPEWCKEWAEDYYPDDHDDEIVRDSLHRIELDTDDLPNGVTCICVQEVEEVVTTHLTQADAEWFIQRKQHDYPQLYTYVESAYWSPQLRQLQDWIISLTDREDKE